MSGVHRNGDQRGCGAATRVTGQSTVYVNGLLVSVDRDPNSHSGGTLNARNPNVYVNGKLVVIQTNSAAPDGLCPGSGHCNPHAVGCSGDTYIGG